MSFENQGLGGAGKGFEGGAGIGVVGGVVRDEASCIVQESSGDSGSTLKAHDYIGLSEVTSMPVKSESKALPDLNLGETELRLGPPKRSSPGSESKNQSPATEAPSKWHEKMTPVSDQKSDKPEQELQNNVFWQPRMIPDPVPTPAAAPVTEMNTGYSNVIKKRVFSEAIGSNGFVDGRNPPPPAPAAQTPVGVGGSPSPVNGMNPKNPLLPSSMYPWGNKQMPAAWRMGLDQSKGSFGPFPSSRMNHPVKEASADKSINGNTNSSNSPNSSGLTSNSKEDTQEDVAPSTSPPVVGWPPVQSFRKNTLASHPAPQAKPSAAEANKKGSAGAAVVNAPAAPAPAAAPANSSPLFVKVYMDGVPIGRKVDLKANNSYDKLSAVLEDMFHRFITGQTGASEASSSRDAAMASEKKLNFLQSSDFVLTYEDKDGDLMLVGDVPWGMFTGTVKRLRIMKGSEAIGLAPRAAAGDKA